METLFKALGDATRLRILGLLLTGEVCVCDIHESLKIPQPKASRHLAYLRAIGAGRDAPRRTLDPLPAGDAGRSRCSAPIVDAVRHALTHVDTVHRDAERLQKRTGCCVPDARRRGRGGVLRRAGDALKERNDDDRDADRTRARRRTSRTCWAC